MRRRGRLPGLRVPRRAAAITWRWKRALRPAVQASLAYASGGGDGRFGFTAAISKARRHLLAGLAGAGTALSRVASVRDLRREHRPRRRCQEAASVRRRRSAGAAVGTPCRGGR